jgi:N-acetylneuraminic acid mutarotase
MLRSLTFSIVYIFGGVKIVQQNNKSVPNYLNDLWCLNVLDKIWKKIELQGAPAPRYRHEALISKSQMYIVGGQTNSERFA